MKKLLLAILAAALLLPLFACAGRAASTPAQVSGRYVRANGGSDQDKFTVILNENGRFTYYESAAASHIGLGCYTVENGIVTLTDSSVPTADGTVTLVFKFRYEGKKLVFLASESDEFPYIRLPDKAEFKLSND